MKIGMLGYGVVGKGVFTIFEKHRDIIEKNVGTNVEFSSIFCRTKYENPYLTTDFEEFLSNDFDVVIEVLGGIDAPYEYVKRCLNKKVNIVTANKALICSRGVELFEIAKENGVQIRYEASVAGVIPIIRTLKNSILSHENVISICGILNGTSNYILSEMYDKNLDFNSCLQEAKSLGYAESDPTDDIFGYDSARKIAILASLITGNQVLLEDVECIGINDIKIEDVLNAKNIGCKIKLVAKADIEKGSIKVSPCIVFDNNKLYSVDGVDNAILIKADMSGEILLQGAGAGSLPTASAVMSDVVEILQSVNTESVSYDRNFVINAYKQKANNNNNLKFVVILEEYSSKYKILKEIAKKYYYLVDSYELSDILKDNNAVWYMEVI